MSAGAILFFGFAVTMIGCAAVSQHYDNYKVSRDHGFPEVARRAVHAMLAGALVVVAGLAGIGLALTAPS